MLKSWFKQFMTNLVFSFSEPLSSDILKSKHFKFAFPSIDVSQLHIHDITCWFTIVLKAVPTFKTTTSGSHSYFTTDQVMLNLIASHPSLAKYKFQCPQFLVKLETIVASNHLHISFAFDALCPNQKSLNNLFNLNLFVFGKATHIQPFHLHPCSPPA